MGRNYAETTNNPFNSVKSSHSLFYCKATKVSSNLCFVHKKHCLNIHDFRNNQKICIVRPHSKRICWLAAILIWQGNIQTIQYYYIYRGCYKDWWGNDCSKPCPAMCVDGHCYPGNGNCVWGCNPDNCLNDICDTATGVCTQVCNIGLSGDYCDKRKF